jgi:WD40 repeat protein
VWRLTDEGVIEALTKGPLVFTGCNQRWVSLLCFNTTGELLCSVGADDDNTLVLWDWQVPDGTGWHLIELAHLIARLMALD